MNAVTEGCPPGEYAYTLKNQVVSCDPFNPQNKPCPDKYSCQYAISYQRYQCCGKEPIEEDEVISYEQGCPIGQVAFVPESTGSPQVCTSSAPNSCPVGYFCQFSDKNKQFQCCAHKSGCPGESVSYIDISGAPKECKPTIPNQCPIRYSCQLTTKDKHVCCTADPSNPVITTTTPVSSWTTMDTRGRPTGSHEKCAINELWIDGACRLRHVGDACVLTEQCPDTSQCISLICACPKGTEELDGRCIKNEIESLVTLLPKLTNAKCKLDEVEYNNKCYKKIVIGGRCEISKQCYNGAECKNKICSCAANTVGYKGRCVTNICGVNSNSEPQLKDSMAVVCTKSPCSSPYKCTYSQTVFDYVCCKPVGQNRFSSNKWNKPGTTRKPVIPNPKRTVKVGPTKNAKCADGSIPLLFPRLNVPIACGAGGRCPKGYLCQQNMCCKTKLPGRSYDEVRPSCPYGTTEVGFYDQISGSVTKKCGKIGLVLT